MSEVNAELVKQLREMTGAGMMDCKKALAESAGSIEKAVEFLRKKGMKDVAKRAERTAAEGTVFCYVHGAGRIGVMIELNCETDFVARGEDFQALAKSIAMHIAWSNPRFLERAQVSAEVIAKEEEICRAQLAPEQLKMADKIIPGKLEKFYQENCLLEQLDARDPAAKKRIGDLITELSAKVGERMVLKRFVRYELGHAG